MTANRCVQALGRITLLLAPAVLVVASAAESDKAAATKGMVKRSDVEIVDCLLPGQVRQLGTQMTYLTPRRPIKTSAANCEIRGGEYVAHDRANFRTALQVWLPLAQSG